jgi:hypothetical protein
LTWFREAETFFHKFFKAFIGEIIVERNRPTLCVIFLWNSDADRIRELKIGSKYKFKVAVNEQGDEIIAFLLPNLTYFKLIKEE